MKTPRQVSVSIPLASAADLVPTSLPSDVGSREAPTVGQAEAP
jgi:hypothetical protein